MVYFKRSMMRLMCFIALIVGSFIGIASVILGRDLTAAGILVGAFLVPAFGGKFLQKKSEGDNGSNNGRDIGSN